MKVLPGGRMQVLLLPGWAQSALGLLPCGTPNLRLFAVHAQHMYRATYSPEEGWRGQLEDYGLLQLAPSAQVWHA